MDATIECDPLSADAELERVRAALMAADPDHSRTAKTIRYTFDQLYDGQRTGRYSWDQLNKTERTHFGTLIEINLRREFDDIIRDGAVMDFQIAGIEVDCKYSQRDGGWMVPPEAFGHLLLVCTANDAQGTWSLGLVRAEGNHLRESRNRDGKTGLSPKGRDAIRWLERNAALPPNVLLALTEVQLAEIFKPRSGQARLNQLFRTVLNTRISRNVIATVAQQQDYMKRVRGNGGSRSALAAEGIIILGGDYSIYQLVAEELGAEVPRPGEMVSVRVVPASGGDPNTTLLSGSYWRLAGALEEPSHRAPALPKERRRPDTDFAEPKAQIDIALPRSDAGTS